MSDNWPDPTEEMLKSPLFEAIWQAIKTWDINVPAIDGEGLYSGATGNHVRAIMDAVHEGVGGSMLIMDEIPLDRGERHEPPEPDTGKMWQVPLGLPRNHGVPENERKVERSRCVSLTRSAKEFTRECLSKQRRLTCKN